MAYDLDIFLKFVHSCEQLPSYFIILYLLQQFLVTGDQFFQSQNNLLVLIGKLVVLDCDN